MRGIARALTARGANAARGGDWSDVQVAAILRRHEEKLAAPMSVKMTVSKVTLIFLAPLA